MIRREPFGDLAAVSFLDPFIAELDLSGCAISAVPQLLYRHARYLMALNLSDNLLTEVPDAFAELDELKASRTCPRRRPRRRRAAPLPIRLPLTPARCALSEAAGLGTDAFVELEVSPGLAGPGCALRCWC